MQSNLAAEAVTADTAAFSSVTIETRACASIKTKNNHILWRRDVLSDSLGETKTQMSMWRNLKLCHVGVGMSGNVQDILRHARI